MSKHTPGPWKADRGAVWGDRSRVKVARVYRFHDAALIASLPELLAEIKQHEETGFALQAILDEQRTLVAELLAAAEDAVEWLGACEYPHGYAPPRNYDAALGRLREACARARGEE